MRNDWVVSPGEVRGNRPSRGLATGNGQIKFAHLLIRVIL